MQEEEFERIVAGLKKGERLSLSKAITLSETHNPNLYSYRDRLLEIAEQSEKPETFRLAVTGVPGAGKSTLINQLGLQWIKAGHKVAVLAVDPSSEISQGSVLGDKTRMAGLAREESAFIRPSPTRLHLGGVTSSTFEAIMLCETAGYDRILVETVGVGQSETEAAQLTDACLLLLIAGAGDELQAVKRGVLEAADIILINKADGDNRDRAMAAAREIQQVSSIWKLKDSGIQIDILAGSAISLATIEKLDDLLSRLFCQLNEKGIFAENRRNQLLVRTREVMWQRLKEKISASSGWIALLNDIQAEVLEKPELAYSICMESLRKFTGKQFG
jgi:LAO/AO transport system kinase